MTELAGSPKGPEHNPENDTPQHSEGRHNTRKGSKPNPKSGQRRLRKANTLKEEHRRERAKRAGRNPTHPQGPRMPKHKPTETDNPKGAAEAPRRIDEAELLTKRDKKIPQLASAIATLADKIIAQMFYSEATAFKDTANNADASPETPTEPTENSLQIQSKRKKNTLEVSIETDNFEIHTVAVCQRKTSWQEAVTLTDLRFPRKTVQEKLGIPWWGTGENASLRNWKIFNVTSTKIEGTKLSLAPFNTEKSREQKELDPHSKQIFSYTLYAFLPDWQKMWSSLQFAAQKGIKAFIPKMRLIFKYITANEQEVHIHPKILREKATKFFQNKSLEPGKPERLSELPEEVLYLTLTLHAITLQHKQENKQVPKGNTAIPGSIQYHILIICKHKDCSDLQPREIEQLIEKLEQGIT